MKVLKVHIRRGGKGEKMMVYPSRYDAEEVDRNGLGPCNVNGTMAYSGHIGKGESEEWCFITLDDKLADEYALDPDMEIVTAAAADTDMEAWRVENGLPAERIDATRIQAITAKQNAGITLSQSDLDALDPEKAEPGISPMLKKLADHKAFKSETGKS
jgi:hypothetical protein